MRLSVLASSLCLLFVAGALSADEEKEAKISPDKLPAAVKKAVKKAFPDGKIVGASKEKENDKIVYEVKLKVKKQNVEATFTPEGKLVSVEKQITTDDLPRAVRDEMEKRYPGATVKLAEEVTEGKKKFYEVLLVTAEKKTFEVKFAPDGKFLGAESKDKKKGDKDKKEKKEG